MIKATFLFFLLISLWQSTLCLTFQTQSNHFFNQYSILLEPSDSISCPEGLQWGLRREALPRLASVRHFLIFGLFLQFCQMTVCLKMEKEDHQLKERDFKGGFQQFCETSPFATGKSGVNTPIYGCVHETRGLNIPR